MNKVFREETDNDIDSEEETDNNSDEELARASAFTPVSIKDKDANTVLDNADDVPLFEDADKRSLRSVAYLAITKLDPPGLGYKGKLPLSSTLETIGELFGDGLYTITANNLKHKVLRVKENVRISLGHRNQVSIPGKLPSSGTLQVDSKESHKQELDRVERLSMASSKLITDQSQSYTELVRLTMEASATRDRAHMESVNQQQRDFFASLLTQSQVMFQQSLAMLTVGHKQTIELMQATIKSDKDQPALMLDMLKQGLALGQGLGEDDTPPWIQALGMGKDMIGDIAKMAMTPKITMKPRATQQSSQQPTPVTAPPEPAVKAIEPSKEKAEVPFTKEEALAIYELKKSFNSKGIDFLAAIRETNTQVLNPSASDDELENNDKSESNVDGEGNNEQTSAL